MVKLEIIKNVNDLVIYSDSLSSTIKQYCAMLLWFFDACSQKVFEFYISHKMILHTAENAKYFVPISLVKSYSSMCKLLGDFPAATINYVFI